MVREFQDALTGRLAEIESLLPEAMRSQAVRLVKRAVMTVATAPNEKVRQCTLKSLIACVIQAAELGLAVDGQLVYIVPYNTKVRREDGSEVWEVRAQMQISYRGMLFLARRSAQIADCFAINVHEHDQFQHGTLPDGNQVAKHSFDHRQPRGEYIGSVAIVRLAGGVVRYEYMSLDEIESIRRRSKAKDDGPWVTDPGEMRKKTVMRRILKLYADDPITLRAFELEDAAIDAQFTAYRPENERKASRSPLNEAIGIAYNPPEPFAMPPIREPAREVEYAERDRGRGQPARASQSAEGDLAAPDQREPKSADSLSTESSGAEAALRQEITNTYLRAMTVGPDSLRKVRDGFCGPHSRLSQDMIDFAAAEYERLLPECKPSSASASNPKSAQGELLS